MQKQSILKKLIPVIIILTIIWSIFFISKRVLEKPINDNLNFLPSDALWSIQIDLRKLVDKGMESIVFGEEDRELQSLIQEIAQNKEIEIQDYKDYGIEINSSLLLFELNNKNIIGAIINLTNTRAFNKNVPNDLNSNMVCLSQGDVGLLLVSTDKMTKSKKLSEIASEIMSSQNEKSEKSPQLITFKIHKGNSLSDELEKGEINLESTNNSVSINGKLITTNSYINNQFQSLKPADFHIDLGIIPKELNQKAHKALGFSLPLITSISVNYKHSELITEPKTVVGVNADFLIGFKNAVNCDSIIYTIINSTDAFRIDNSHLSLNESVYNYKQINSKTIYIGNNSFNADNLSTQNVLLKISGNPAAITTIKGESLSRRLLSIIPIFKASEQLANSIDEIDLEIKPQDNLNNLIQGEIIFKKDHYTINEILKFLIVVRN